MCSAQSCLSQFWKMRGIQTPCRFQNDIRHHLCLFCSPWRCRLLFSDPCSLAWRSRCWGTSGTWQSIWFPTDHIFGYHGSCHSLPVICNFRNKDILNKNSGIVLYNYYINTSEMHRGYYTVARRCEFCVRVARTIISRLSATTERGLVVSSLYSFYW